MNLNFYCFVHAGYQEVNYQVELDDGRASRVTDEAGMISKEEFIQFAKDTHLLDFETTMGEASPMALLSPRKTKKQPQTPKKGQNKNTEENLEEKVKVVEYSNKICVTQIQLILDLSLHAGLLLL